MLYTGFHRKVNRVGKLVRRSLLMLALVLAVLAPTAAFAHGGGRYSNCRGGDDSFNTWSDPENLFTYHYCRP